MALARSRRLIELAPPFMVRESTRPRPYPAAFGWKQPMIDMTAADGDFRRCPRPFQRAAPGCGAGADRRELGGHFRHRLDRRSDAGTQHLARDRPALDVCGGARCRHLADRRHLACLWTPRRLHHRHRLRHADRLARRLRDPARFVSVVLLRDIPRWTIWRGVAILPLCRRRRRERGVSPAGGVVGHGRRRVRRRAWSAARAMDDGCLVALSVRLQLRGAGHHSAGRNGRSGGCRCAETRTIGPASRPSAGRDRASAAVHRGGAVWRHQLSHHESRR